MFIVSFFNSSILYIIYMHSVPFFPPLGFNRKHVSLDMKHVSHLENRFYLFSGALCRGGGGLVYIMQ